MLTTNSGASLSYGHLSQACTPAAMADGNVHQTCERLLSLMVERSDDLLTLTVGARLAERSGWKAERWQIANDTRELSRTPVMQPMLWDGSCADFDRRLGLVRAAAHRGELGLALDGLRNHLKSEGRSLAEAAKALRDRNDFERATAQAASAAASGAPAVQAVQAAPR